MTAIPGTGLALRRGLSVPCFAEDPADLVDLGVGAERAGLDGYFLWDHLVHADSGDGPPVVDPWWVESPGSRPGWLAAVRERLRDPAGGGAEVQSPRG
jgi:alkanesulfonate monooxygenase SsuD/methylene tetrahydromethanopterin reductase-like flavin-dependent oxidoreductase (luciferase family)